MALKRELENPKSPIRRFFAEHLPHTAAVRPHWSATLQGRTPLLPPPHIAAPVPWDLLGQATNIVLASRYDSTFPSPVAEGANDAARLGWVPTRTVHTFTTTFTEALKTRPPELHRLAVVAGWFEQIYRGGARPTHPFANLEPAADVDQLLRLVQEPWTTDIAALDHLADHQLLPELDTTGPCIAGPCFAGSHDVGGADADIICGDTLIEIKTSRNPALRQRDLHQLVAYALLDYPGDYQLQRVAFYAARFGTLITWPLNELLSTLAGQPTTARALRQQLAHDLHILLPATRRMDPRET